MGQIVTLPSVFRLLDHDVLMPRYRFHGDGAAPHHQRRHGDPVRAVVGRRRSARRHRSPERDAAEREQSGSQGRGIGRSNKSGFVLIHCAKWNQIQLRLFFSRIFVRRERHNFTFAVRHLGGHGVPSAKGRHDSRLVCSTGKGLIILSDPHEKSRS